MKINKKNVEGRWFKFDGKVEFKIRPFRLSTITSLDTMENINVQFTSTVVDWKGIEDEDGKPFKCNEENKKFIYDYYEDIVTFVIEKLKELKQRVDKEIKN